MGKKGKWFSSVKNAFRPESKKKNEQKSNQKLLHKQIDLDSNPTLLETAPPAPPQPLPMEGKVAEVIDERSSNVRSTSTALATAATTDVPVFSAQPVSDVVHRTTVARFSGKSKEEEAAIRIQTAFRGYSARRALRALKGLVRLKLLMEGSVVKRQVANTLRCMQTISRVQSQIRARRIRMSEENQARQRQLLQKHARELASLRAGEEWDDSMQSKEEVGANLLSKYEAAMRRERAMAYAYSHQQTWKTSTKCANPMFMDPGNPTWGCSWLERLLGGRSWESKEKEPNDNDNSSVKGANRNNTGGQVTKSFIRQQLNSTQPNSPSSRIPRKNKNNLESPSTPSKPSAASRKSKPTSFSAMDPDDDVKSMVLLVSVTSYQNRRHSIAGSSVRDEVDTLGSSPTLPSYMVATESTRARLKSSVGPLGLVSEEDGVPEKVTVEKRLNYPALPAPQPRRSSAPPNVENGVNAEIAVTDGSGS